MAITYFCIVVSDRYGNIIADLPVLDKSFFMQKKSGTAHHSNYNL